MSPPPSQREEFLKRITEITKANLANEQFGVSELAREIGMSRSNLHRKVRSVQGTSVSQFINQVRLKRALELLKGTSSTISEVAFECGFNSVSYFTKCFHDFYGYPPGQAGKDETEKHRGEIGRHKERKPGIRIKRLTLIISGSLLLAIVAATILMFIIKPFAQNDPSLLDKSIAVLPFRDDSPGKENEHIIDGTMESILNNLSKIKDLRVPSRTSVEVYRNNPKPVTEISKDMNVSYILEGSGQRYGDNIRLSIQLIDAIHDRNIWSEMYDRKIIEIEELFALQSEIAQLVAAEIEAAVTPEERIRIEKIPTKSLTAYELYQKAIQEYPKPGNYSDKIGKEARKRVESLLNLALEYDSTYGEAYNVLAWIYLHRYQWETQFTEEQFLDTSLFLVETALSFDNQISEAYVLKGYYYSFKNLVDQAIEEYDRALRVNPNDILAYQGKAHLHLAKESFIEAIQNFQAAALREQGNYKADLLRFISNVFCSAGFKEQSEYYSLQALDLSSDSALYFLASATSESQIRGNYPAAISLLMKGFTIDSVSIEVLAGLGLNYLYVGQFEESLKYFRKLLERLDDLEISHIPYKSEIGYSFWKNGFIEESDYYFNKEIEQSSSILQSNQPWQIKESYHRLAAVYAFRGDKEEAYRNLRKVNSWNRMSLWAVELMQSPLFESISDEPEFQQILRDVEAKYQAEHERVRQWLEEQDRL